MTDFEPSHSGPTRIILYCALISLSVLPTLNGSASTVTPPLPSDQTVNSGTVSAARELVNAGRFESAVIALNTVILGFENNEDPVNQTLALVTLGEVYQIIGNYKLSKEAFERAQRIAEQSEDKRSMMLTKAGFGNACLFTRDALIAEQYLNESMALAEELGDQPVIASIHINLGNLMASREEYPKAAAHYETALSIATDRGSTGIEAKSQVNHALSEMRAGNSERALYLNDLARVSVDKLGNSYERSHLLIIVGNTYRAIAENQETPQADLIVNAHGAYRAAIESGEQIKSDRILTFALGYIGRLYELEGRYPEGLRLTREAAFIAQKIGYPGAVYRWQWQTGRILAAQKELEPAIELYKRAVKTLQSIRHDVAIGNGNLNTNSSFRKSVGAIYFELADLLFQKADAVKLPEAVQQCLIEARDTIELLKSAELDDYFQDDCVNLARSKVQNIDFIDDRSAVIYIIPLADRVELLLTLPSGLHRYHFNIGVDDLTKEVRLFRRALEKRTSHRYIKSARKLYEFLIQPIEEKLKAEKIDTLIFVPDGALLTIPMSALYDGEKFLIDKYSIGVIPGLTLMDPKPIHRENTRLLLSGLSEGVQGFPGLDFVPKELKNLGEIYTGSKVFRDKDFSQVNLQEAVLADDYTIMHIATHGQFNRDASKTFLLTHGGKLTLNNLESLIRPSQFKGNPVELLTLSACQTAAGDDRAALGLAGTGFKAGARSVLATLWFVNDQASTILISEFYRQLQNDPTITKAKALRKSQVLLMRDPRFRHPRYWAPYLMIGNWL